MLHTISTNRMPNLKYEEVTRQFFNNMMAFTYGHIKKDTSCFDPIVLAEMKKNPDWLENATGEMQTAIIQSLEHDENFKDLEQLKKELSMVINLYFILGERDHTIREESLFLDLHDKFILVLLSSDKFIQLLERMEAAANGN